MKPLLIFFLLPLQLFSQDITGVWTGTIYNDTTQKYIPYEIAISEHKGKLSGFSHTVFIAGNKNETGVKAIKIKKKNEKIFIEDDDLIYNNYSDPPPKGVRQFSALSLSVQDSIMILSGPFNTNRTREYLPLTGTICLTKKNNYKQTNIAAKLRDLNLMSSLSFLEPETKEIALQIPEQKKPLTKQNPDVVIKKDTQKYSPVIIAPVAGKKELAKKEAIKKQEVVIQTPKPKEKIIVAKITPVIKQPFPVTKLLIPEKKETAKPVIVNQPPNNKPDKNISQPEINNNEKSSLANLENRKIETIKTVFFTSDSLTITLYDNGEVDGDVVSVILNGQLIMPNQKLSANPITKTIYITPELGDSIQLIMYAENLGSIPPNTGLLILQDGAERYEIRFAGDLQKNSAIILKKKK